MENQHEQGEIESEPDAIETEPAHPEPEATPEATIDDADWLLALFVRIANASKGNFGLTLWTSGAIVSGTLVGVAEYLDGVASDFDEATGAEVLGAPFRELSKDARQQLEAEEAESIPVAFIHLKDARTYSPGGEPIPANRGVWWRARLESVDAWCFGELRKG
jgi:hypothetical protein